MLNVFDIAIFFVLLLGVIIGFKQGVIKEAVALIGIILVFIFSFLLRKPLGNLLCVFLPFFKFKGAIEGLSTINILIYQMIAFIIVFSILLTVYCILLKISKILQKIVNITLVLIIPSKLLGGLIAFVKTYIVLAAIFMVLMIPIGNSELFKESSFVNFLLYKTPIISDFTKKIAHPVNEIYSLTKKIENTDKNEVNAEILDIMLKYKVVNRNTIENLVKFHKLDDIKNIEMIINKY